jgi:hypothetical protein
MALTMISSENNMADENTFKRDLNDNEINFLGSLCDELDENTFFVEEELRELDQRYQNRIHFAEGGLKVIEKADDLVTGREVALAVPRNPQDEVIREKFLREARITATLQHPNIVPVYDMGLDTADCPYMAMKLIRGQSLQSAFQENKLSLDQKLNVFIKVCDAISYAHSMGIIHLDIKPDNIQISSFGEVLVCDWGLATIVDSQCLNETLNKYSLDKFEVDNMTLDGVIKGTPGYMAPEQISGERKTASTDIYALGAMLFEILYGRQPVNGKDTMEKVKNTLNGKIIVPDDSSVPLSLKAVALKALSTKPEERYSVVIKLRKEIRSFQTGHATSAENAGPLKLLLLLVNRNRTICATFCVFILILIISTLIFIQNLQEREQQAQELLLDLQAEISAKLKLGKDAVPNLIAKAQKAFMKYNIDHAAYLSKDLLSLLPDSREGRNMSARVAFVRGYYSQANEDFAEPETPLDKVLIDFALQRDYSLSTYSALIKQLGKNQKYGSIVFIRGLFEKNPEFREQVVEELLVWRFAQDTRHLLEMVKLLQKESQREAVLNRLYVLLNKVTWAESSEIAREALAYTRNVEIKEKLFRLCTRNLALMRDVNTGGTEREPARNAVDGRKNPANRWEAAPLPVSLNVDLGSVKKFNKVIIYFDARDQGATQYEVLVSEDGKNFKQIVNRLNNYELNFHGVITDRFSDVEARYIQLRVTENNRNRAYIKEIEVFPEEKNCAIGQYCWTEDEVCFSLTDGISARGVLIPQKASTVFNIDLGADLKIKGVKVSQRDKSKHSYKVHVSKNGKDFQEVQLGKVVGDWVLIKPQVVRFVKYVFVEGKDLQLRELRVLKESADITVEP